MAKFTTSGIIQTIRGKVGNLIFSSRYGMPVIRQYRGIKMSDLKTEPQLRVREAFLIFLKKWKELSIMERNEWEIYAKTMRNKKITTAQKIIKKPQYGLVVGRDIYLSVNEMLTLIGFNPIQRPPRNDEKIPPTPSNDLVQFTQYKEGKIKFNIWNKQEYTHKCKTQIWIKVGIGGEHPYIIKIVDTSTTPVEIRIENIRIHDKKKVILIPIKKMKRCDIKLQMRTIAENGKISIPTAIYHAEIIN